MTARLPDTRLQAAVHYAAMGWAVFPAHSIVDGHCTCGDRDCDHPGKHPRPQQAPHGFKNATRTPSVINRWSSVWERSNIAVATGAVSGVFVVDVDPRNGGQESFDDLVARYGALNTLTASTGGGGQHYVFKQPARFVKPKGKPLGVGIDILSDGGCFIVQPSVTTNAYAWMDCDMPKWSDIAEAPSWLIELMATGKVANKPMVTMPARAATSGLAQGLGSVTAPGSGNLAGFDASKVHTPANGDPIQEGGRNIAAASLAGTCFEQGLSLQETRERLYGWNSSNPVPMSDNELNTTIDSVKRTHERNHPGQRIALVASGPRTDIARGAALGDVKATLVDRIPGVLGQVEDYYNATGVVKQPAFAAVASIALGSVALARRYVSRLARDSYSGLYLCEVGGTGCGKEHAHTVVNEFLNGADLSALIGPSGYTSAAGVFSALIEQPSHFAFMDELGRHLAASKNSGDSHQQQMISELLKLWGTLGSEHRYRGYSLTGMSDKQKAEYRRVIRAPSITLLRASTPRALFDAVGNAGILDGFLNRPIFFFGDDAALADACGQRAEPVPLPPEVIAWLKDVQRWETQEPQGNLVQCMSRNPEVKPTPMILHYDDQAHAVVLDLQSEVEKRKSAAKKGGLAELYMRTFEKATRLALIAAVSDGSGDIKVTHPEWGARRAMLSDSALGRAAEGNIAETDHGRLSNAIWRAINQQMPVGG